MVEVPSQVKQLSLNHVCKIGLLALAVAGGMRVEPTNDVKECSFFLLYLAL
jgi:hypothetical protein